MSRPITKFTFLAGVLACSAALLLSSCSKKNSEAIIGKWRPEKGGNTFEFTRDGVMNLTQQGQITHGTYKFTDDSHFTAEMTMSVPPAEKARLPADAPDSYTITAECTIKITGDFMDLSANMSKTGEPSHTEKARMKRIK